MAVKTTAPGYLISWPFKFEDIDGDALAMVNRLCALFRRMKKKYAEDELCFIIGGSEYSTKFYLGWNHKMVYQTAKKKGGRKVCVAYMKVNKFKDGERIHFERVEPAPKTEPHIHIMLEGKRASTHAQTIINRLNKLGGSHGKLARKNALPDSYAVSNCHAYIEGQSTHYRTV